MAAITACAGEFGYQRGRRGGHAAGLHDATPRGIFGALGDAAAGIDRNVNREACGQCVECGPLDDDLGGHAGEHEDRAAAGPEEFHESGIGERRRFRARPRLQTRKRFEDVGEILAARRNARCVRRQTV
jgi:hypothetical protein